MISKIKEFGICIKPLVKYDFLTKFNLKNHTVPLWHGTRICRKKDLKSPQWLREIKIKKRPFYKVVIADFKIINNGGWHFTWLKVPKIYIKNLILMQNSSGITKILRILI